MDIIQRLNFTLTYCDIIADTICNGFFFLNECKIEVI